jgi:purine-binding chemotaxis protein CheW
VERNVIQMGSFPCVVFRLDALSYGVRLSSVIRVLRAVEITPLPQAPPIVIGVIDLEGRIIPVVNLRRRFGLPERELELTDQLIVARTTGGKTRDGGGRILALVVDGVDGVCDLSAQETAAETILPGLEHLHGVAQTSEGLVLIHDLDTFLSLEEEKALSETLHGGMK